MAYVPINASDAAKPGTYRLNWSYPAIATALVPDLAGGTNWSLFGYRITLISWSNNELTRRISAVIRIEDTGAKMVAGPNYVAPTQTNQPLIRTSGGYVKAAYPQTPAMAAAFAPALIPLAEIALAVAGLAFIWLTLESVEEIVDSPGVNLALVAVAAVVLWGIWKQAKA